jgi:predicted nucleotidyltransferase component of viral defense system
MLEPAIVYQAYREQAPVWRTSILREYLQLKTLQYIYGTTQGRNLVFMGGTAIHLLLGSPRFSEDLDFDNRGVSAPEFHKLGEAIVRGFALEGVVCEAVVKERQAMTATVRFTDILQRWELTGHRDSVLRIKVDTEPQGFVAVPERRILSRLDVFVPVSATPAPVLLSQKFIALLSRPRTMGRDLYDISWLLGRTMPDYACLQAKIGVRNGEELRSVILAKLTTLDLADLRTDVLPFLPNPDEADRITLFTDFIRTVQLQ